MIGTVRAIYEGSDGDATRALYAELSLRGPVGNVALNLFRANKNSERAKRYRGGVRGQGSYKSMAYERKNWALANLCTALERHDQDLGIVWGWRRDDYTPGYEWVLYVETPHGQVSFHAAGRGRGPDFTGKWDGSRGVAPERIIGWCEAVLALPPAQGGPSVDVQIAPPATTTYCENCAVWWPPQHTCPNCRQRLTAKLRPTPPDVVRPGVVAEWSD